ncbi:MAG: ABC transporter permease [Candidatus Latescibacteria bacterium]|nr:ABC transporter permease [Candidatus Latescibacterota bacterium]
MSPVRSVSSPFWKTIRRHPLALTGGGLLALLAAAALLAPLLAPADPLAQDLYHRLQPPGSGHLLGTDEFGRDILSRVLYGARISLRLGILAITAALGAGTLLGLVAGYRGGWADSLIMRLMDLMLAFPSILLAIAIVAIIGPGIDNVMIAVSIVLIPQYARLVRGAVLSIRELNYVEAARALGATDTHILARAILPNCLVPLIVQSTLSLATAILDAAGLSFLGLGAQPPLPEWGAMLSGGRDLLLRAPWVMAFPGLAIFAAALGLNLFGDGLRDALDPRGAALRH